MNNIRLINGEATRLIDAADRGLQYGDGVFETIAVIAGRPRHWQRHLQRLRLGCERLGIDMPDEAVLQDEVEQLCQGQTRAVLKLILTRGAGGRGYRPPHEQHGTRILSLHPWPDYPPQAASEGVAVRICATRLGCSPSLAGIKHLNRLEQVLARAEWDDPGIAEGLMLDTNGHVIEATMSNLFLVEQGRLISPDLSACGVAGIMRGMIIDYAEELGLGCEQRALELDAVFAADERFLCNSLIGIWPIRQLGDSRFSTPGTITRQLQQGLNLL